MGSSTITTPNLPNRESFGANHDPSKSPAANYQLGYPSLSSDAYQATSLGKFEVINSDGSTTYATLDDALNAAESNATEATGEISLTNTQEPNKEQSETTQNNGETSNVGFIAGAAGLLAALAAGATAGIRRKLKK